MKRELINLSNYSYKESIFSIHDRMLLLCEHFEKEKKYFGFLAFLKTYQMVTKEVLECSLKKGYFQDVKKLRELDVIFAGLYFKPLNKFLMGNKYSLPWKNSFKVMSKNAHLPFLQMLLGISSHINGDLPLALLESKYKSKKDFIKINLILEKQIPSLMEFLAFHENDFLAFGGIIFKNFVLTEFHRTVIKWRNFAWKNYQVLKNNPEKIKELRLKTEELNKKLLLLFSDLENFKNLDSFIEEINKLKMII